jgi:hypothetical protein
MEERERKGMEGKGREGKGREWWPKDFGIS